MESTLSKIGNEHGRNTKRLRHALDYNDYSFETRVSLKSVRIVEELGDRRGEQRAQAERYGGREREGALYETKPHYCKW